MKSIVVSLRKNWTSKIFLLISSTLRVNSQILINSQSFKRSLRKCNNHLSIHIRSTKKKGTKMRPNHSRSTRQCKFSRNPNKLLNINLKKKIKKWSLQSSVSLTTTCPTLIKSKDAKSNKNKNRFSCPKRLNLTGPNPRWSTGFLTTLIKPLKLINDKFKSHTKFPLVSLT